MIYITTAVETQKESLEEPETEPAKGKAKGKGGKGKGNRPNSTLSLRGLALTLADGKVIWDTEVFKVDTERIHKKNSHASPTPLFSDGVVYVHFGPHGTAALNAADGKILWTQNSLPYPPVHGSGSFPDSCRR